MESPNSARGRGRFSSRKRHTFPARSSSQRRSEPSDTPASTTPAATMAPASSSFSFETPSPSSARGTRTRTRHVDGLNLSPDEAGSKGGRSLRKRTRVDYSFDQADEEDNSIEAKATPSAVRSIKKRRTDLDFLDDEIEQDIESRVKRRNSEQPPKPVSRRSVGRKTTMEPVSFIEEQSEENSLVHDTIEVGGHQSTQASENSSHRRTSSASSHRESALFTQLPPQNTSHEPAAPDTFSNKMEIDEEPEPKIKHEIPKEPEVPDIAAPNPYVPEVEVSGNELPDIELPENGMSETGGPENGVIEHELPEYEVPEDEVPEDEVPEHDVPDNEVHDDVVPKIEVEATKTKVEEPQPTVTPQPVIEEAPEEKSPASSPAPASAPVTAPAPALVDEDIKDPFLRLTPYVRGATVGYPTRRSKTSAPEAEPEAVAEEAAADDAAEDATEAPDESTPAASPGAIDDLGTNSPAPEPAALDRPAPVAKKQYMYKKLRPAEEFINFIADYETLSHIELYERLELLAGVVATYENEYRECRKIIDDEENATRYHQEEGMFQHRVKMARSKDPDANPLRKEFVVKGIRATKPDAMIAHARQQDRIMADAYGFEYDDRDSKIGQQDPIGQRGGVGKGRLRDRPKQTAKAAEADDPTVVHGKRARKAPNSFVEPETASRGSTPVPTLPRKRRGRPPADESLHAAYAEHPAGETPKKKGKGGRPRKHPLPTAIPENTPVSGTGAHGHVRKRRRKAAVEDEDFVVNGTNGQPSGLGPRRRNSRIGEIPSGSFYSATSANYDESRPATSSSTATASTSASAYGLREKRQTKFSLDDDDDDDDEDFEEDDHPVKPKRIRRVSKKVQEQDFANITPSNIPPEADVAAGPKVPKIRIKGFQAHAASAPVSAPTSDPGSLPVSSSSTPGQTVNGHAADASFDGSMNGNKDYGQMTKSEKMSASMKARWASGSMSRAVEKRRATLAAKKAAAQTPVPDGTPETGTEQQ
ncbi:hypothetical protein JX266_003259 [Neoarthrinium moseri]|nr:hypothetical protein JX266_003259 [Neoarthrinium moseri]